MHIFRCVQHNIFLFIFLSFIYLFIETNGSHHKKYYFFFLVNSTCQKGGAGRRTKCNLRARFFFIASRKIKLKILLNIDCNAKERARRRDAQHTHFLIINLVEAGTRTQFSLWYGDVWKVRSRNPERCWKREKENLWLIRFIIYFRLLHNSNECKSNKCSPQSKIQLHK